MKTIDTQLYERVTNFWGPLVDQFEVSGVGASVNAVWSKISETTINLLKLIFFKIQSDPALCKSITDP